MADTATPTAMDTITESTVDSSMPAANRLDELSARATAEYAVKHYKEAAELYSEATELQAEINGEMAVENADLLYAYGKCLYFLAQQSSNVLGGTAASAQLEARKEPKPSKKRKIAPAQTNGDSTAKTEPAANGDATKSNVADVVPAEDVKPEPADGEKPYFQITGDTEDWDESDEDEEPEQADGEEEEQDDLQDAFEMLDLARVLYLKKLDTSEQSALESSEKGKYVASIDLTPEVKNIKRQIADIHDLQSEVSLEGEKYAAAVEDLTKCLALKEELEPPESSLLAECHYKLSLALEFNSQSQQRDADGNPVSELTIDWTIRNEAIAQQEKAIESCKLRIAKETKELESLEPGKEKDKRMAEVEDVQEMVTEMQGRLGELRKAPISVKEETQMKEQLSGVLGTLLGATDEEKQSKLAQMSAGASDISGLVKKKKVKAQSGADSGFGSAASTPAPEAASSSNLGKRKVDFMEVTEEIGTGKKAKVEDVEDSGK